MTNENLDRIKQEIKPNSQYVKFNDGETKTLLFNSDESHTMIHNDERFGKRVRFIVTDMTDSMRPVENKIWDVSRRWANQVISQLDKNNEMLEITRQGTGTTTVYAIASAIPA